MTFPKFFIRIFWPFFSVLAGLILYMTYSQMIESEEIAIQQSKANLITAQSTIKSHVEAAYSKFYLLQGTLVAGEQAYENQTFRKMANAILSTSPLYSRVYFANKVGGTVFTSDGELLPSIKHPQRWTRLDTIEDQIFMSSIYQNNEGRWSFAIKRINSIGSELWIEFDLNYTTRELINLKTLSDGYVYIVEHNSERMVFHPDPSRIGETSRIYAGSFKDKVERGVLHGLHEYYYLDAMKLTAYDADNMFNWVFVSGTDRGDIFDISYQFVMTGTMLTSLLALALIINYLIHQAQRMLASLNQATSVLDYKSTLKAILDSSCYHRGIQFCLNDPLLGFVTLDFHGNKRLVMRDGDLADEFLTKGLTYRNSKQADTLAVQLSIKGHYYRMPLVSAGRLIAVVYVRTSLSAYPVLLKLIKDYCEIALANILLQEQLRSQDPMTQLDNKSSLIEQLVLEKSQTNRYLAMIDIDNFKRINEQHGHPIGDQIIVMIAQLMREYFPKPYGRSLARYGGEEFAILFEADSHEAAFARLESLRESIAKSAITLSDSELKFTASIGLSPFDGEIEHTLVRADTALYKAKRLGKNQVC